jgi:hypothetical protein
MRKLRCLSALALALTLFSLLFHPAASWTATGQGKSKGQGLVIELDNEFIEKYAHLATITSDFTIAGISAVHPPKNDGEVHIGGWSFEAGLPGVAEVMNAATTGKTAVKAFRQALAAKKKVTVTGAWRLWGEHPGSSTQIQARGVDPKFPLPGEGLSNPDHVFEIHPVTTFSVGDKAFDATDAIGDTAGFTPHDAQKAFLLGYEKLNCKIIPKGARTRIITESLGFNFTTFVIKLAEDPVQLADGGHGVICSVYDTDGEFMLKELRMVFIKGTDAADHLQGLKKDARLTVTGIPRISLMLVQWRLQHKDDKDFDISPLEWRLPYEMIIVAASPPNGEG